MAPLELAMFIASLCYSEVPTDELYREYYPNATDQALNDMPDMELVYKSQISMHFVIAVLSVMSQLIYLSEFIPPFVDFWMSIVTIVQLILLTQNMRILMYFSKRYMAEGVELD